MPRRRHPHRLSTPVRWQACPVCALLFLTSPALAQDHAAANHESGDCVLGERIPPRAVVEVTDAETLVLDDGSRVRLAGALAPRATDSVAPISFWQPEADAKAELTRLAASQTVDLRPIDRHRDRHGRILAHVFIRPPVGEERWLQGELLSSGHARAHGIPGSFTCMDALLAAEALARNAGRGLWQNPAYAIRHASRTYDLLQLVGTYQVVEGVVTRAQRIKSGRVYLNFGDNWREDFSGSVSVSLSRSHPAWSAGLVDLAGRRVRIRGWISRRNGPLIEIEDPSQLEFIEPLAASRPDDDATPPASPPR